MAILSKKLDLVEGIWQEIGNTDVVLQQEDYDVIDIVNADALPVGVTTKSHKIRGVAPLQFTAPKTGSLYAMIREGTATLTYYEV